ncbi:MAG: hypothetical protein N3H30_00340 [Candidatus Micrarchaeota archaeon]|nr:hypothetical protein [Candidatus Micrarchaeota archaeon]
MQSINAQRTLPQKAREAARIAAFAGMLVVAPAFTSCGTSSNIRSGAAVEEYQLEKGAVAKKAIWEGVVGAKADAVAQEKKAKECKEYTDVCKSIKEDARKSKGKLLEWLRAAELLENFIDRYPQHMDLLEKVGDRAKEGKPEQVVEALKNAIAKAVEREL